MWARQVSRFGGVAVRLYGRGNSIEGWAEQILSEVDGELVLVGHSMGGYTALAMAGRAPERVRALVLAGARAGPDTPERQAFRGELFTPDEARDLAASASNGRVVVFEGAGHFMSLDRPDEFDAVVAQVLA